MSNQDLASLLADILDESKPLPPTQSVARPEVAELVQQVQRIKAASPVDDFMAEYLGEEPEVIPEDPQVTQLCETLETVRAAKVKGATPQDTAVVLSNTPHNHAQPEALFTDQDVEPVTPIVFPKFTTGDFAADVDLRNFATLVTLNTSRWHAKVKDKEASRSAARASNAVNEAFETRKNLLVGADASLKAIHRAIDEARAAHYEMTVPWTTTSIDDTGRRTGGRLLPNTLFVEYTTIMAQKKAAMNAAIDAFIPEYPALIQAAQAKLGDRFVPSEYPNPSSIRNRFDLSFEFNPIPKGDDFKGLAATQLQALAKKLNQSLQVQAEYAMQDLWSRLHDAVGKMAERLSSPDKTFHNTLVQNVRDVARLAGHLNVTGDVKVEEIRKLIELELCPHDPKDLREKPVLRQQVAAQAQSILDRMSR